MAVAAVAVAAVAVAVAAVAVGEERGWAVTRVTGECYSKTRTHFDEAWWE